MDFNCELKNSVEKVFVSNFQQRQNTNFKKINKIQTKKYFCTRNLKIFDERGRTLNFGFCSYPEFWTFILATHAHVHQSLPDFLPCTHYAYEANGMYHLFFSLDTYSISHVLLLRNQKPHIFVNAILSTYSFESNQNCTQVDMKKTFSYGQRYVAQNI